MGHRLGIRPTHARHTVTVLRALALSPRRGHVLLLNYCNETWVSSGCWLARQAVCAMASRY